MERQNGGLINMVESLLKFYKHQYTKIEKKIDVREKKNQKRGNARVASITVSV